MNEIVRFTATPPAPGAAGPGDLYVELSSRSIWVGVDPAVDPSHYVLLSDILSIQPALDANLASAKSYTDSVVTSYAPLASPTFTGTPSGPTAAPGANTTQLATTAFVTAGIANRPNQFARGMIMMYSGVLSDIGIGSLAGWALCDGSNGTPDLRDKFILGAGNKTPGAVNPQPTATTNVAGAFTPVINAVALTVAQMPFHSHTVSVSGSGSFNTGNESQSHTHANALDGRAFVTYAGGAGGQGTSGGGFATAGNTNWADRSHYHAVTVNLNSTGGTDGQGSSAAHTHSAAAVAGHSHTVTSAAIRDALPYYALAFIMRL